MLSKFVSLEEKMSQNVSIRKTFFFIVLFFVSTVFSGCGTIGTWFSYKEFRSVSRECDREPLRTELFKRRCRDQCYSKFNWSGSPLLDYMKNLDKA